MKKLLLFAACFPVMLATAQTIPNPGMENWQITAYDNPDSWYTSNDEFIGDYGIANVIKVNPAVNNFGVKLVTISAGANPDTLPGFITNSQDPFSGEGGQPFSEKPTSLTGNFRYNILGNDTAFLFVIFKSAGAIISSDTITFTGSVPNFVFNTYALPALSASPSMPDSVIIVAVSSNFINNPSDAMPGSTLEMDDLAFAGPGITQTINNGTFDNWTSDTLTVLQDWQVNGNVSRTTDKYSGTYAAKLISDDDGNGGVDAASIFTDNVVVDAAHVDTLSGFYKYSTSGNDSVSVDMIIFDASHNFVDGISMTLPPMASYSQFKIPLTLPTNADNILISFTSSTFGSGNETVGSTLYLDSISIIEQGVGVKDINPSAGQVSVYPNPATEVLNIHLPKTAKGATVVLYDAKGSVVYKNDFSAQPGNDISVPVKQLAHGLYLYEIKAGENTVRERFVKD